MYPMLVSQYPKCSQNDTIHWWIQGALPAHTPPQQDQFLLFLHMFLPKSVPIRGWCPLMGWHPPMGNPGSATAILWNQTCVLYMII